MRKYHYPPYLGNEVTFPIVFYTARPTIAWISSHVLGYYVSCLLVLKVGYTSSGLQSSSFMGLLSDECNFSICLRQIRLHTDLRMFITGRNSCDNFKKVPFTRHFHLLLSKSIYLQTLVWNLSCIFRYRYIYGHLNDGVESNES